MPKVSVELVQETLAENELDPDTITKLIKNLEEKAAAEHEAELANREPSVKKQYVLLVSDPRGVMPDQDFVGWVVQLPEDDPVGDALDRIVRASYEYNVSKKGRKYPVKTIGEAAEAVGARFLKEQGVAIKNKVPVSVIVTDNKLPEIESDF